ncbi:MAG: SPFH domain-containing protein [Janthinobacterium lividum]
MVEVLRLASPLSQLSPRGFARWASLGAAVLAVIWVVESSYYVVQPTEMAGVRRFGVVISPAPAGPGLHWKLPVDSVDYLQVSLTQFQAGDLSVYTIDNQAVRIGIGLSYRVPTDAVFKLLYTVGRSGNVDIDANLRPIVADRALRVFARRNTVNISAEREAIANEVRRSVQEAVSGAFGIEIVDLQLSRIEYSAAFTQSVEAAVRAKNDALQAENTVGRIRYEGEQAKVQAEAQAIAANTRAEGEARAAVTRARAEREATVLRAEGTAQATALTGQAEANAVQLMGAAVAANPRVVEFETARRWSGLLPTTMLGSGTVPMLSLPGLGLEAGPATATPAAVLGR